MQLWRVLLVWLVHANLFKEKKEFTRVSLIANLPRTWQFYRIGNGWKLIRYKIKIFGIARLFQANKEYSQTVTLDFRAFSLFYGKKESDHEGTRTPNLPIRSRTPYPLGHAANHMKESLMPCIWGKLKQFSYKYVWIHENRVNLGLNFLTEVAYQRARKVLFTCVVYTKYV